MVKAARLTPSDLEVLGNSPRQEDTLRYLLGSAQNAWHGWRPRPGTSYSSEQRDLWAICWVSRGGKARSRRHRATGCPTYVLGSTETHLVPHLDRHSALFFLSLHQPSVSTEKLLGWAASPRNSCSVGRDRWRAPVEISRRK